MEFEASGESKNFERGGRKTIYQLHPHLSQMCTTKYTPFTWKKSDILKKKNEPNRGGGPPHHPLPLNPPLVMHTVPQEDIHTDIQ